MSLEVDIARAGTAGTSPADGAAAAGVRRRGWWLRRMYSPVCGEQTGTTTAPRMAKPVDAADEGAAEEKQQRAWRGWLRRLLVPREHALLRRWKRVSSRLAAGLRWKRVSSGLSVGGMGSGCASELLNDAAFRVMYVVEAVVLGLALSCFFCCCGCQI